MQNIEDNVEEKKEVVDENMSFSSIFKSMIPSIMVGTTAAAGCQELASEFTSNPEAMTVAGMAGQYVGGWGTYVPIHYFNNRDRLKDEKGKIKWKQLAQDMGAIVASDRIGNKVWLASYGLSNEISLRNGLGPTTSGIISGTTSGLIYSTFTSYAAPKVNSAINYLKRKLKRNRK